jgi:hypothetical protein
LPSSISIALTNPEIANGIGWGNDLAAHEIRRCIGALVVNTLAADINSRTNPISNVELECLSIILGTKSDVMLLLRHPGTIEFTNILFLTLAKIDSSGSVGVSSDVLDAVQQTFGTLTQALPAELNAMMRLDQTNTLLNVSDGQCEFVLLIPSYFLKMHVRNLIFQVWIV